MDEQTLTYLSIVGIVGVVGVVAMIAFMVTGSPATGVQNIGGEARYVPEPSLFAEKPIFTTYYTAMNDTINCTYYGDNYNVVKVGSVQYYDRNTHYWSYENDSCITNTMMMEYWCSNGAMKETFGRCNYGCSNDRCNYYYKNER